MAKRQMPTVRVIWYVKGPDDQSTLMIEQLRYMGLVNILKDFTPLEEGSQIVEKYEGYYVLEFSTPHCLNEMWAKQNAARMCSFGINAVEAPRWGTEHETMSTWIETRRNSSVDGNQ